MKEQCFETIYAKTTLYTWEHQPKMTKAFGNKITGKKSIGHLAKKNLQFIQGKIGLSSDCWIIRVNR